MHDTIAALATPAGRGGIGIIRVSGKGALLVLNALVHDWPDDQPSHMLRLSRIFDQDRVLIDESLVVLMRGPRSYTGEDVVEFQCHGGPVILRRVLDATMCAGARMARPGEFTERAFLNARLDLTQAEAVADLILATSTQAHKLALEHLHGTLGTVLGAQIELLVEAAMLIESAIDFSHEEHVYQIEREEIMRRLEQVHHELDLLRTRFDRGRRQREGIRVVLAGPTNAGKSSLFNALHGSERAIVTDVEGTTRDFLEEELQLAGVAIRLVDTAGLRVTKDEVEILGMARSRDWARRADILLWLVDRTRPLRQDEREALQALMHERRHAIVVLNKQDLPDKLTQEDHDLIACFAYCHDTSLAEPVSGVQELTRTIELIAAELTSGEGVMLSRARHLDHVCAAIKAIAQAKEAVVKELSHELVAIDVREAIDELGEITGRVTTDDILNRIFSSFCVGK